MKDELKSALETLDTVSGSILYARYSSAVKDFADVENVLFYNVGSGVFSRMCKKGIAFEREFEIPPAAEDGMVYEHYQVYTSVENDHFASKIWRQKHTLARWESISLRRLNSDTKLRDIWRSMVEEKGGAIQVEREAEAHSNLGISLMLTVHPESVSNPANVMKALLDGIISSFQAHNGMEVDEVSQILALQLREDGDRVRKLLTDRGRAVLGVNRLLKRFRNGVQWNPVDDRLVYGRILVDRNKAVEGASCRGEIFEVTER